MTKLIGQLNINGQVSPERTPNKAKINVTIAGSGPRGKSAYQVWLENGNSGSEEDFLESLKGEVPSEIPASSILEDSERVFLTEIEKIRILADRDGYIHTQLFSTETWDIVHNLEKFPAVTIVDSAGSVVVGEVQYVSMDHIIVSFTAEFSGIAYLR